MHYDLFKDKLLEAGLDKNKFINLTKTTETTYNNWAKKKTYETERTNQREKKMCS